MSDDLTRLGLVDEEDIILDEAALSLALLDHPGIDLSEYHELLGAMTASLADVGKVAITDRERADALVRVLGSQFGFTGDRDTYDDAANADLIQVLDRRRGLPVSLSILYVAAARRLGWTANVLDLPGHVVVLIGDAAASVIIDPFRGGITVDVDQLAAMAAAMTTRPVTAVNRLAAMPNRAILVRLLLNQATRAEQAGKGRRALVLYRRMTAIAPDYGQPWWERARLELVDHDIPAARSSLTAMLEVTREPDLRGRISDTLAAIATS